MSNPVSIFLILSAILVFYAVMYINENANYE